MASVPTRRPAPPYAPVARTASSSEWSALSYVEKISDREHQTHARLKESVETKRRDGHVDVEALDLTVVGGGSSAAPMLPRYVRHVSTPVGTSESTAVSFVDTQAVARSGMQVGQGVLSIGGHAPRERWLIRTAIVRDVVLGAVVSCQPSAPTSPHFVARALCKGQWGRRVRARGQRWSGVRHADMPRQNTHLNSQRLEPQASIDRAMLGRHHPRRKREPQI